MPFCCCLLAVSPLLFDDEDHYPLDKWVLNTEAHPLPVFQWTQEEKEKFGIP